MLLVVCFRMFTSKDTATIDRVEARSIVGDVVKPILKIVPAMTINANETKPLYEVTIEPDNYDRIFLFGMVLLNVFGGQVQFMENGHIVSTQGVFGGIPAGQVNTPSFARDIPRNTRMTLKLQAHALANGVVTTEGGNMAVCMVVKK